MLDILAIAPHPDMEGPSRNSRRISTVLLSQGREFDGSQELEINLLVGSFFMRAVIMDTQPTIFDLGIDQWSVDARLRLIDEIRESLPSGVVEETGEELSEELKALLDERLAAAEANPEALLPWKEVLDALKSRR